MCATIDKMNKRQRILLLVMSTLLEAWYTIFCTGGIGLHWFIYVYIVIKHIKTYNLMKRIKHPIFLPILLILFGSVFSCMGSYLDIRIGYMNFGSWNYFSFATALGMFLLFYSIKLPDCKILNWFSDKVLGVYLLHENKFWKISFIVGRNMEYIKKCFVCFFYSIYHGCSFYNISLLLYY